MINVQLGHKKSKIEHRSSNISHPGENVAHTQPSVSHEEEEIQNPIFSVIQVSIQVKILKRMIEYQQQRELKRSQKMRLRVGSRRADRETHT